MPFRSFVFVLVVVCGAWGYLYYASLQMAHEWMPSAPWLMGDFAWVFTMWAVMMAAMMLPSALPMLNAFSRYCRRDPAADAWYTLWFGSGYLAVWSGFSVVMTVLQWLMHGWAWLSPMMENRSALLAVAILAIAGLYQFTPLKNACLRHCRSPFGFLLNEWRPGKLGALRTGLKHGLGCLGCCWAQMLIMFAIGVMNLSAMALITLLVIVEKWAPLDARKLSYGYGVLFLLWSLCYAAGYFLVF